MLDKLGITESFFIKLRFISAVAIMLIFSIKKTNCFYTRLLISFLVLYVAFGIIHLCIIIIVVLLNLAILHLNLKFFNEYFFIVMNIFILYVYKLFGKTIEPAIQTTYDISGFLMVFVIKSSYLSCEYNKKPLIQPDVKGATLNEEQKVKIHTFKDAIDYIFFLPGLLSGPTPTFYEFTMTNKQAQTKVFWTDYFKAFAFLLIYSLGSRIPFLNYILTGDKLFRTKMLHLYAFNVVMRNKFYFIWNFADICFRLHGFDDLLNIDFFKVELCESVREISSNWNKFVSRWLKILFFNRLRKRSMHMAVLGTYIVSACLHGFNLSYLIFFLAFGLFSDGVTRINNLIRWKTLRRLQMILFVSFFSIPFYLLDLKETYNVMKSLKFFGWYYFGTISCGFIIYDVIKKHLSN